MKVKKGDTVILVSGKDKGKTGKILEVFPKKDRVIVEGINMVKKHKKPTQKVQQGGIVNQEAPVHVSNVMYYDKKTGQGTKIGYKVLDTKEKVRVSRKTGEVID
ncbi:MULTISPECIES: 50S ribosomal protein L24 [Tindallia]|uniref:Large ribosomal subunit protein uL24 n=2 Tax=Tindallia TaxID=69894 RepID=A0A1H3QYQ2_9FIRM|nr:MULTISPECIES: 50S ribosomal protein L24 [Tindallia]SDZ18098.1 LSU ribosomal protein L24P [Tindallia californiensis]SFI34778.1 LSU ribosomal protein L24P [Tindallia magadiensis]